MSDPDQHFDRTVKIRRWIKYRDYFILAGYVWGFLAGLVAAYYGVTAAQQYNASQVIPYGRFALAFAVPAASVIIQALYLHFTKLDET